MKLILYIFIFCSIYTSCDLTSKKEVNPLTVSAEKSIILMDKDTSIMYNLENLSSEGVSALAKYQNGRIINLEVGVYACTWQAKITYAFNDSTIDVSEKRFEYSAEMENIKTNKDMILKSEVVYSINYEGNIINKQPTNDIVDVFSELKEQIPFKIPQ